MKHRNISIINNILNIASIGIFSVLFIFVAAYLSLMALTIAYASSTKEFVQLQQKVKSDIAKIESEYFSRTSAIAITDANTFGLTPVVTRNVVDPYDTLTYVQSR